jgi:phosphoglucomutase
MAGFRENPPKNLGGSPMVWIKDYANLVAKNLLTGEEKMIHQKSTSDVLQFFTRDGIKISVRPSGTEPKIKFYFEVKGVLKSRADFNEAERIAEEKIEEVMRELGV